MRRVRRPVSPNRYSAEPTWGEIVSHPQQLAFFPIEVLDDPDAFRNHPLVGFDSETMPVKGALALPVVDPAQLPWRGEDQIPPWRTWFGGRPLVPPGADFPWPRGPDGQPLAHVFQIDLAAEERNATSAIFDRTGLVSGGVLQVFHDLSTYGNASDPEELPGAWNVRWLPTQGESPPWVFQDAPADLDTTRFCDLVVLNTEVVPTIPNPLDLRSTVSDAEGERYRHIYEWLEEAAHALNPLARERDQNPNSPWDQEFVPTATVSRMGGYEFVPHDEGYEEELREGLPLSTGDFYVPLLQLNPADVGAPVDWFHGLRPLQVWIRASDLRRRKFDAVWCHIRTDA